MLFVVICLVSIFYFELNFDCEIGFEKEGREESGLDRRYSFVIGEMCLFRLLFMIYVV